MPTNTRAKAKDLVITRIVAVPRERLWEAWTEPIQVQQWWGPEGFTNPTCDWNAVPGGDIYIDMKGPDDVIYPMEGIFHEAKRPGRLKFTASALGLDGKALFDVLTTVTLEEKGDKTKLTIRAKPENITPEAKQYLDGMEQGWNQTLDRLAKYLR